MGRYVPSKPQAVFQLRRVTTQKTVLFIITVTTVSNPTYYPPFTARTDLAAYPKMKLSLREVRQWPPDCLPVQWSATPLETIAVAGLLVALIRAHKSPAHRKGGEEGRCS
jgi:hypothetical protein